MYDIIIVGAGPAGLSAAVYGLRAGKSVLLLEKESYGGQIINTPEIENYPGIKKISGYEFAENLYQQAVDLGAEIVFEAVTAIETEEDIKKVFTAQNEYLCKTVILATGATHRKLGIEREEELAGKGVSYCATCDGMFFKGKDVAVAGGGNTALQDALFLSNYCRKVYLIHRREEFRGEKRLEAALREKDNIEFVLNCQVTALNGEKTLTSVTVRDKNTEKEKELSVSGIFIAVGQEPQSQIVQNMIDTDEGGYIISGEECYTNCSGIFTAGDCRTKSIRQLATAVSDGAVAALKACEYMEMC
ncbi:MAG: thioredoxin-disulfide reductase [Lachnospiraceae bacterium]|mgnify:CR=1 FL=1|jgi:thioredoxin-disulfide reductase|nr:thioredoxin-disulfide reductase [Lachnospiraceae bacterium]MCI8826361.1 thioredoxin-disulfide reductase [Lachnospiraceae bacterium]MCI9368857.1 thioredoxin-disulfide reductase [Lachnospiraceae bacterium]MDE7308678.1 thioredoxin-disulfide reductase [Lachnospiraceae bacterium]